MDDVTKLRWSLIKLGVTIGAAALVIVGLIVQWPLASWWFALALLFLQGRLLMTFGVLGPSGARSALGPESQEKAENTSTAKARGMIAMRGLTFCAVFTLFSAASIVVAGHTSGEARAVSVSLVVIFIVIAIAMAIAIRRFAARPRI